MHLTSSFPQNDILICFTLTHLGNQLIYPPHKTFLVWCDCVFGLILIGSLLENVFTYQWHAFLGLYWEINLHVMCMHAWDCITCAFSGLYQEIRVHIICMHSRDCISKYMNVFFSCMKLGNLLANACMQQRDGLR